MRSSLFGNLFGVLALFQSGRLVKVRTLGVHRGSGRFREPVGPIHTHSLRVSGLGGAAGVREAAAGPGPAPQPPAGAAPEGPGGHPV